MAKLQLQEHSRAWARVSETTAMGKTWQARWWQWQAGHETLTKNSESDDAEILEAAKNKAQNDFSVVGYVGQSL